MRTIPYVPAALAAFALVTAGCGGSLKCADGTFKKGDKCVAYDPDDETAPVTTIDPPGGRSRAPIPESVTLTTDEPATIYYTTDGTAPGPDGPNEPSPVLVPEVTEGMTIRFYAVDPAGNQEAERSVLFSQDITAPAPVAGFEAVFVSTNGALSWTNPGDADYAGTLVARVTGLFDFQPVEGEIYTAGVVTSSVEIVVAGTESTFDDPGLVPGFVRYAAWTYDDLGNYSPGVVIEEETETGSLDGQIVVDVAGGTVTVLQQPAHLTLSGTMSYNIGALELTVSLTVENELNHVFTNPKLYVMNVSSGGFANADGNLGGEDFRFFGPEALVPAQSLSRDLVFSPVSPLGVVQFDVTVGEDGTVFSIPRPRSGVSTLVLSDMGTGTPLPAIDSFPANIGNNGRTGFSPGVASPDRRWLWIGDRHRAEIQVIDRATHTRVGGVTLSPPLTAQFGGGGGNKSGVLAVERTPDGQVLALVRTSNHWNGGDTVLYRLDEGLEITGYLPLDSCNRMRASPLSFSPDGTRVAIACGSRVLLVHTRQMALVDTNPAAAGVQHVEVNSDTFDVQFASDETLYVLPRSGNTLRRVDLAVTPPAVEEIVIPSSSRQQGLSLAPDGTIWIARWEDPGVFDPQNDATTVLSAYPFAVSAIRFLGADPWVARRPSQSPGQVTTVLDRVDGTGAILESITIDPAAMHWFRTDLE